MFLGYTQDMDIVDIVTMVINDLAALGVWMVDNLVVVLMALVTLVVLVTVLRVFVNLVKPVLIIVLLAVFLYVAYLLLAPWIGKLLLSTV